MPTYEYLCDDCGLRFEKIQTFSAPPVQVCPNCNGAVHRVIQPVGVIFKGSGFYVTDNRSRSSTAPSTKRDGDGAKSEKATEGASAPSATTSESKADAAA